jgi:hypothetical protein
MAPDTEAVTADEADAMQQRPVAWLDRHRQTSRSRQPFG